MKYDLKSIFKAAWIQVKNEGISISIALKKAWAAAKANVTQIIEKGIFNVTWSSIKGNPALELELCEVQAMTVGGSLGYVPVKGTANYYKIEIPAQIDGNKIACCEFLKGHFAAQSISLLNIERIHIC